MIVSFFPRFFIRFAAGPKQAKNPRGANVLRLIQLGLTTASFGKICVDCKDNSPQGMIGAALSLAAQRVALASPHNETDGKSNSDFSPNVHRCCLLTFSAVWLHAEGKAIGLETSEGEKRATDGQRRPGKGLEGSALVTRISLRFGKTAALSRLVKHYRAATATTEAHPNATPNANSFSEPQTMNIEIGHLFPRRRIEYNFGGLVDRTIREQRREERRLAEGRSTKHRFKARSSCVTDGRNYRIARPLLLLARAQF